MPLTQFIKVVVRSGRGKNRHFNWMVCRKMYDIIINIMIPGQNFNDLALTLSSSNSLEDL